MALIASSLSFTSCSKDEENSNSSEVENSPIGNTTEKIKNRELFGYWQTDDTKSKRFSLYSDGTGFIESWKYYSYPGPGSPSGYHWEHDVDINWAYDTETKVLALSNGMALNVKLLTSDMLSAEWTSSDRTRTDTWTKGASYVIDPAWKEMINGTWKDKYQEITFNNGKFSYKCKGNNLEFAFSGQYTKIDGCIVLQSDEAYDTYYYDSNHHDEPSKRKIEIKIQGLNGTYLVMERPDCLYYTVIGTNTNGTDTYDIWYMYIFGYDTDYDSDYDHLCLKYQN